MNNEAPFYEVFPLINKMQIPHCVILFYFHFKFKHIILSLMSGAGMMVLSLLDVIEFILLFAIQTSY